MCVSVYWRLVQFHLQMLYASVGLRKAAEKLFSMVYETGRSHILMSITIHNFFSAQFIRTLIHTIRHFFIILNFNEIICFTWLVYLYRGASKNTVLIQNYIQV